MYKVKVKGNTTLDVNNSDVGQPIEEKIAIMLNNGEPISEGADLNYTERKEGVVNGFNPRTDRWEVATDAMDVANRSKLAKRTAKMQIVENEPTEGQNNSSGEQKSGDPSQ